MGKRRIAKDEFLKLRQSLKAKFDQEIEANGLDAAIRSLLIMLAERQDNPSELSRFEAYIFAMLYLAQQCRVPTRPLVEMSHVQGAGKAILRLLGIDDESPIFGFMARDLRLVISQLHRLTGQHLQAAWGQLVAARHDDSGDPKQQLGSAMRFQRIGLVDLAAAGFAAVRASDDINVAVQAEIALLKMARLSHQFELAAKTVASLQSRDLPEPLAIEVEWEELCCQAIANEDWRQLNGALTSRKRFVGSYIIEAWLWLQSRGEPTVRKKAPKLSYLRTLKTLGLANQPAFLGCAMTVEKCYDTEIPLQNRLDELGEALEGSSHTLSFDKELLVWSAAGRWLRHAHLGSLAEFVVAEYQKRCRVYTNGAASDCFRVFETK